TTGCKPIATPITEPKYDSTKGMAETSRTPAHCSQAGKLPANSCRLSIMRALSSSVGVLWSGQHTVPAAPLHALVHRTSTMYYTLRQSTDVNDARSSVVEARRHHHRGHPTGGTVGARRGEPQRARCGQGSRGRTVDAAPLLPHPGRPPRGGRAALHRHRHQ